MFCYTHTRDYRYHNLVTGVAEKIKLLYQEKKLSNHSGSKELLDLGNLCE